MIEKKITSPFWSKNKKIINLFNIFKNCRLMFVGGVVRNALVNVNTFDIDMAIDIAPKNVKKVLCENKITFFDFSKGHGTITIPLNKYNIEITSLRIDKITFGRKAKVEFTNDFFLDSCRRDFTINAIYSDFKGELFNPQQGVQDLDQKIIKFIGNPHQRIKEDNLRVLRYFRFVAVYNSYEKQLDKNSYKSCIQNAKLIKNISKERINLEFCKLLVAKHTSFALLIMKKNKILDLIIEGLGNISLKNINIIDEVEDSVISRISFLFLNSDISKKNLIRDLRIKKKEINFIVKICEKFHPIDGVAEARKTKYRYGSQVTIKKYMLFCTINRLKPKNNIINLIKKWEVPVFPINGNDIRKIIHANDKRIGLFYSRIENWWMDNNFKPSREQCLSRLRNIKP